MSKPMAVLGSGWGWQESEMGRHDNVICAWAWAGLDGLRN